MRLATGAMMNSVRKSERPMTIWFDGALCTPKAVRTKPSTITMRVKLVISMTMAGARVSTVMKSKI